MNQKPFYQRLRTYFAKVGDVLVGKSEAASIFPNPSDIGSSRELLYAEMLKLHVPLSCKVICGGFLFNMDGKESGQIDVIAINNVTPQFNFYNPDGSGKSFACVDGAVAAISLKSNLNVQNLHDALLNIASIPPKLPLSRVVNLSVARDIVAFDWPYKIVYAPKGVGPHKLVEAVQRFYQQHSDIAFNKRPNLIHVAEGYYIIVHKDQFISGLDPDNAWSLIRVITQIQKLNHLSQQIYLNYEDIYNRVDAPEKIKHLAEEQAESIKQREQQEQNDV